MLPASKPTRLDLLASLGGAHIMHAMTLPPTERAEALKKAGGVCSRAETYDIDYPSIWTVRGFSEFMTGNGGSAWFEHAMEHGLVLGAIGLAAIYLNRPVETKKDAKKDPVALLVSALRAKICPPGVWTGLAYALFREGRFAQARSVAQRAVAAVNEADVSERREALYVLAVTELASRSKNCAQAALTALAEAVEHCEGMSDARVMTLLAHVHFLGGDFEQAEVFAKRAVDHAEIPGASIGGVLGGLQNGVRAEAVFQLARVRHHLGKVEEAVVGFEEVKNICDGHALKMNPGTLLRLGMLKLASGRKEEETVSQECLERVLKISHDKCGIAKRALGVLLGRRVLVGLKKGRPRSGEVYERAVDLLKKGLEEEDGEKDVAALLVYAALVEEYYPKKALEAYRKAVKAIEDDEGEVEDEVWNNMSSLLARIGDLKDAVQIAGKIAENVVEETPVMLYNRARLAEMEERVDDAVVIYEKFKKGDAMYHDALLRLADITMTKGELDKAESMLKETMENRGTKSIAIVLLSQLFCKKKKFGQAQGMLEKHRDDCQYILLAFTSFMHSHLHTLSSSRRNRFLRDYIGFPLVSLLKRNSKNASAANGAGVYFAEMKLMNEARDAFTSAMVGPHPNKTTRVNLAHTLVLLGMRELHENAKQNGRPSQRALSSARGSYELADKLYMEAREAVNPSESKGDLQSYCELTMCSAWARFEARNFRESADRLQELVHLVPSNASVWFNLGYALLECATKRSLTVSASLREMEVAREEFDGSRIALQACQRLATGEPRDALSNTRVSRTEAHNLERYVRHVAHKHNVQLVNAKDKVEDREKQIRERAEKAAEKKRRADEQKRKLEEQRIKKEEELRRTFLESQRKQKEYAQAYEERQRNHAVKEDEDVVFESGEEKVRAGPSSSRKKRKVKRERESPEAEDLKEEPSAKKKKNSRKVADDSGSEYSDLGDDAANGETEVRPKSRFKIGEVEEEDVSDAGF